MDGQPPPHPLLTPFLWGLRRRALDVALTLALLALLASSRVAAFPAGVWEQDEAYFGAGVVRFEPTANHPHPPWFPLWIAVGKALRGVGAAPTSGLCVASATLSVWLLFPLASLMARMVRRELAVVGAAFTLLLPGPWLLAGRAFSEVAATALLTAAAALWADERGTPAPLAGGSLAAGLALLVRPQLGLGVVAMAVVVALARRGRREWLALVLPGALALLVGYAAVVAAAGGVGPLRAALAAHAGIHFGAMDRSVYAFAASGVSRCLGGPLGAAAWLAATALGLTALARRRAVPATATWLVAAGLLGLVVTVWGLSNPAHPRYSIPLLVLSAGPAVAGLAWALGRLTLPALGLGAAVSAWAVVPALATVRTAASPPVAALRDAIREAERRGAVVVADSTLVAFVELERLTHGIAVTVLYDYQIERGETPPPPPFATVAVWDDGHDGLVAAAPQRRAFTCAQPLLRRLSQDRFLDLTVAPGATLRRPGQPPPG